MGGQASKLREVGVNKGDEEAAWKVARKQKVGMSQEPGDNSCVLCYVYFPDPLLNQTLIPSLDLWIESLVTKLCKQIAAY